MPIGETLSGARQRAGLTVAQVSEQTRITQTIIAGIEGGVVTMWLVTRRSEVLRRGSRQHGDSTGHHGE